MLELLESVTMVNRVIIAFVIGLAVLPIASLLGWLKVRDTPDYWVLLEKFERLKADYKMVQTGYEIAQARLTRLTLDLAEKVNSLALERRVVDELRRRNHQLAGRDPNTGKNTEADYLRKELAGQKGNVQYWMREADLRAQEKEALRKEKENLLARNISLAGELEQTKKAYATLEADRNAMRDQRDDAVKQLNILKRARRKPAPAKKPKKVKARKPRRP